MTAEQFRPTFTTSAEAHEKANKKRKSYFGNNIKTVEGTTAPKNVKKPLPNHGVASAPSKLKYRKPGK